MRRHFIAPKQTNLISQTDQNCKSLHETLDEYLHSGVLDVSPNPESYDFDSADEVDFNKDVAHDVDLYDAVAGIDNFYPQEPGLPADNSMSATSEPVSVEE